MHWVVIYELYNNTIVRPFKGDELMRDEYYDGNHSRDPMSLMLSPFKGDELMLSPF